MVTGLPKFNRQLATDLHITSIVEILRILGSKSRPWLPNQLRHKLKFPCNTVAVTRYGPVTNVATVAVCLLRRYWIKTAVRYS